MIERARLLGGRPSGPAIFISSAVRRFPGVATETIDDVTAAMSVEKGSYFLIEGTGNAIWNRIEETVSVSALCAELVLEFDVDPATCESDVLEFLNDLQAKGLVQAVEA